MERLARIAKAEVSDFIGRYMAAALPVIVTDAMESWPAKYKWTPAYFRERFGHLNTQIYDNLFTLLDIRPLRDYIDRFFDASSGNTSGSYARWYVKFKNIDFFWSDAVFDAIAEDWGHPYFLPNTSYIMPFCKPPDIVLAHRNTFPYKGLFISSRGSRTRLHRDPFGTDAVLCQFHGSKSLTFYQPADDDKLRQGTKFVDPRKPDRTLFPNFPGAVPAYRDELVAGEVLYIPSGWFHDVDTVADSISVTWNFVHVARSEPFIQEINDSTNNFDRDMLDFFFSGLCGGRVSVAEMAHLARSV
jgi:Cupin-like domain